MQSFPEEVIRSEVRKKLLYIVKFSLLEAFYEDQDFVNLRHIAETVFSLPPADLASQAKSVYRRISAWHAPAVDEINEALDQVAQLLSEIRQHV